MRIDNGQTFFPLSDPAANWSDTEFSSETLGAVTPLPTGHYRVTIFTNAIPSFQQIISIAGGAPVAVEPRFDPPGASIQGFTLSPVAPTPGCGPVRIEFAVPREAHVRVSIVDVQGRQVAVIADGVYAPGRYRAVWSGERQG